MNIAEYAKRELDLIGLSENNQNELDLAMRNYILEAVAAFGAQGFSGFSASNAIAILTRLLQVQPLSALTGVDSEWNQVEEDLYQNVRCPSVFKNSASAWDINGKIFVDSDGNTFTSSDSRVFIYFPYAPSQEFVNVNISLRNLSVPVSDNGKECVACKSSSLTPFPDKSITISLEGEQTSVPSLSGWNCSDCNAEIFDLQSAEKYSSYVTEFASHIAKFKKESSESHQG